MAALGDISSVMGGDGVESSMEQFVPVWPDVSMALPTIVEPAPAGAGFSGHFSFS